MQLKEHLVKKRNKETEEHLNMTEGAEQVCINYFECWKSKYESVTDTGFMRRQVGKATLNTLIVIGRSRYCNIKSKWVRNIKCQKQ